MSSGCLRSKDYLTAGGQANFRSIRYNYGLRQRSLAMPTSTALKVAPTENGCVIRIEGRGTMKESPAASGLANRTLSGDSSAVVVIDLSACTYLDSTFLGCLTGLYGRYGHAPSPRFFVAGSPEKRKALLGAV